MSQAASVPAGEPGGDALDAYSKVVAGVASVLIPSVASLRVLARVRGGRVARGAGSAVAITPDGYLRHLGPRRAGLRWGAGLLYRRA